MIDKGNCESCGHKIQNTVLDKCMYCGVDLLNHQKFSDSEKEEVLAQKRQTELDAVKAKLSEQRKSSVGPDFGLDPNIEFTSDSSGES